MKLTGFIGEDDVREKMRPLRPKGGKLKIDIRAKQLTTNDSTVLGTAFDYLLRFDLQRRAPHAVSRPWVAEQALKLISPMIATQIQLSLQELTTRARTLVANAKAAVAEYLTTGDPTLSQQMELACHALRSIRFSGQGY